MSIQSFLYRRMAPLITAELQLPVGGTISLRSKHELGSFQDVFCSPFYWRLYEHLNTHPRTVLDLGAHRGHFTILADQCVKAKFGCSAASYVMIEANPFLIPTLTRNIALAGLAGSSRIINGLAEARTGSRTFYVSDRHQLSSSTVLNAGRQRVQVPCVDLDHFLPTGQIDVVKMDIEGSEYELIREYRSLWSRVSLMLIELHGADPSVQDETLSILTASGLRIRGASLTNGSQQLLLLSQ
jgi:FkbM family methyltransferase